MSQLSLDVIRGIAQAAANSYDGALDEQGQPIKIGLKREEGRPMIDSRVMDGFKVRLNGDKLIVSYQSDIKLKDVYKGNFQNEIESTMSNITNFLKKEYKSVTGSSLSLTKDGDADILVQNVSNYRTWCQAQMPFVIGGLNETEEVAAGSSEDRLDNSIKKFLELGKGPKPKNVTRRND